MSSLSDVKLNLVTSVDEAFELLRWLGERHTGDCIGFDIETGEYPGNDGKDALSPYRGRIRLAQIGDENVGWAMDWNEWSGLFYEAMSKYEGDIVCHNIAFEAGWMTNQSRWEFPWYRSHDTMIAAKIINPAGSGALKELTAKYIDRRAAAMQGMLDEVMKSNGWTWGTIPTTTPEYWSYGALDPVLTARLWNFLRKEGIEDKYRRVYDLEMAARRVVSRMELNGAPVDLEYSQRKYDELTKYVERTKEWCRENAAVSIGSNVQLARFFTGMGAEITRTTKSGAPSVDKTQLKLWANVDDDTLVKRYAKLVLDVRAADKIASSYFKNFLSMHINGKVHPQIKTLGARTGRMSCVSPALQTLPKGNSIVRDAFIASPGNKIVTCDMDQVEARLLAHFGNEHGLAQAFAAEEDFFVTITRQIFNDSTINKEDKRRSLTKNVVYARLYGAGLSKMAETAGVSERQMKVVVDAFDVNFPGVSEFQSAVEQATQSRLANEGQGYVITPFGRKLPCDEGRLYTGVNYLIQAHAAELLKEALVRAESAGLGDYLILPVHDEIVMNVPEDQAKDALRTLRECMEVVDGSYLVPLTAGPEGPFDAWGEKYRAKPKLDIEEEFIEVS